MGSVRYYRDPDCTCYQVKKCFGQSHASRKHTHTELAIALVTGGSSLFRFGDEEHWIHEGQLVMIGPGFVHQCCPDDVQAWSFYMVFMAASWLDAAGLSAIGRPCFVVKDLDASEYRSMLLQFEALCHPSGDKEEALIYIADMAISEQENSVLCLEGSEFGTESVIQVREHIREHLTEPIRLDDLAKLADMNKFMLIRYFSRVFNTTPHAWQNMLRMNEARLLLERGNSIADTALAVGFYDQSHFSRNFKEYFGITPKRFVNGE